ncbi:MAG: zinc-dependent metalloprotease [Verrucomicrobia bacterium]|nr:zinc-dependent metalloprotease [Verrucomicrobiota bacterium]
MLFPDVCSRLTSVFSLILLTAAVGASQPMRAQSVAKKAVLEISAGTNYTLVLPRTVFGKEHLMSASRIPQSLAATSTGLSGKIVKFELFHDGVDLYEATDGLVVTKDLPARRILTTFPIVEQDANKVVIDFNRGMRRLYTEIWYGQGRGFNPMARDESLEIPQSRVFQAEKLDNQLVIRQSVQVRDREAMANVEQRFEVRYFFTPYEAGSYKGKEAPGSDLRYSRFFETQARLEESTGRPSPQMARFDISKPVVFHYSANTPVDYVEAVKDGILYWNRAFGTNLVRAEKAPAGVTAPDARYNIVQWVPWDNAGFAYADILIDPRTGESEHGQAYMTSVFALSGKARARALLRSMRDIVADKKKLTADTVGGEAAQGFPWMTANGLCHMQSVEFAHQYAQGLEDLLSNESLTDAGALRASQDYVREVVAHEVGHVLGLRHNFAGSVSANMSRQQIDEWFQAYVTGQSLDAYTNHYASSSIMEYTVFKSAVQVGWFIRTRKEPLPHDKATIQWGYFGGQEPREKKMLFGSDELVGTYGDLQRFDEGVEPVVGAYSQLADDIRLLPNSLIETFISAKAPRDSRDATPIAEVNLSPARYAAQTANHFALMLSWFRASTRSLRVENQFEFIGELNQKDRAKAHWKDLNDQVERIGGVDRALFSFLPLDLKLELKDPSKGIPTADKVGETNLMGRLRKLLDAPAYTNFVGLDEKKYAFSAAEKELILKRGEKFFREFEKELVKQVCARLENSSRDLGIVAQENLEDADITAKLEQRIIDTARLVLTAKDESKRLKGKVDKSFVEVVDFRYEPEVRMAAAKMLNDKTGTYRGWATDAKGDLNKSLKDDIDGALNIANFKDSMLSRTLREWYLKQQDILGMLPPKPAGK